MKKKAQGLSLNTIIVAAIVLIVLVVLWAIFTGRLGAFAGGVKEQEKDCPSLCKAVGHSAGGTAQPTACTTTDASKNLGKIGEQYCCCT